VLLAHQAVAVSGVIRRRTVPGQGLVEFALVLPLLILLIVGIFDFGRAVYSYNAISNAARIGNRVAIVDQNVGVIKAAAVAEAVAVPITDADVAVSFDCQDQIGCLASVSVEYDYVPATPMIEALVGNILLTGSSEMPIERVFVSP
jgi:Flp pilus assembly protein TadG